MQLALTDLKPDDIAAPYATRIHGGDGRMATRGELLIRLVVWTRATLPDVQGGNGVPTLGEPERSVLRQSVSSLARWTFNRPCATGDSSGHCASPPFFR